MYSHVSHDYEWTKVQSLAWVHYQNAVKTQSYIDHINQQYRQIKELQNTIDEFSNLLISEIKDYLQRMFADKLSSHVYRKIMKAVHKAIGEKQEIIKLQFSADMLRFSSPNEIHALILDRFMMHVKKEARFRVDLTTRFTDEGYAKAITYQIIIPQMMYNYSKLV